MTNITDLSLTFFSQEKYYRVATSNDFQIILGDEGMANLFPGNTASNFLSLFNSEEQEKLKIKVEFLRPLEVSCCTLQTLEGVPFELSILRREHGLEILCRNITDRLQTLEQQMYFYRYFLTTPTAICITDAEANIINANQAFLDLYDYRANEVIGKQPSILKSGRQNPDVYKTMWQQITDPECGSWTGELINRKSNGEEITVMLSVSAGHKADGTILGYIANAFDISRQKWLEQNLQNLNHQLNETSHLKSELMTITSHDLKSPIHAIVSRAALIKETLASLPHEKLVDHLDKIIEAGGKMGGFIDDLLDLEKAEAGKIYFSSKRLQLDKLTRGCVEAIGPSAASQQIELKYQLIGRSKPLRADRLKLEQVVTNLLANAIKFSPPGSEINIVCRNEGSARCIDIIDQGPGIPAKDIDGIFDRFAQVRQHVARSKRAHGIGLGLNIVQKYIEMHHGKVTVTNSPGPGCKFTVELPDCGKVRSGADLAALILDPDNVVQGALKRTLEQREVCCYVCKTAEEVQRTIDFERPELFFVHEESLTPELKAALDCPERTEYETEPFLINVRTSDGSTANNREYFQSLQTPIVDIEILSLLNEVISQLKG